MYVAFNNTTHALPCPVSPVLPSSSSPRQIINKESWASERGELLLILALGRGYLFLLAVILGETRREALLSVWLLSAGYPLRMLEGGTSSFFYLCILLRGLVIIIINALFKDWLPRVRNVLKKIWCKTTDFYWSWALGNKLAGLSRATY